MVNRQGNEHFFRAVDSQTARYSGCLPWILGPTLFLTPIACWSQTQLAGNQEYQITKDFGGKTPLISFPSHNYYHIMMRSHLAMTIMLLFSQGWDSNRIIQITNAISLVGNEWGC